MATESAHEFFVASAGVAGALIGLLFVAISVAPERVLGPDAHEVHAVRASATLTAFTNALTVSLFALIPGFNAGGAATFVALIGIVFVVAAVLRLIPTLRDGAARPIELTFLVGLLTVFVLQLLAGIHLDDHPRDTGSLHTICILVVVCFLIGIARAWELVGGPHVGLWSSTFGSRRSSGDEDQRP